MTGAVMISPAIHYYVSRTNGWTIVTDAMLLSAAIFAGAAALLVSEAMDRRGRKLRRGDGAARDHRLVRLHMTLLLRRPRAGGVA